MKNSRYWGGNNGQQAVLLCLVALVSGCNQDMSDLVGYIDEVKARPPRAIEPIPVIKPYVRFIYPGHDRDPFNITVIEDPKTAEPTGSVLLDKNRVPEFMESFTLDSLRMVGTVYKEGQLWALVRIPSGAVHRVRKGNYMGKNHGRIAEIRDTRIKLAEVVENGFGGYTERENELVISSPEN